MATAFVMDSRSAVAHTLARATTMRQRQMTMDHAYLQHLDSIAWAIACLMWMKTVFATNLKSRDAWMTPLATIMPQQQKRATVLILILVTTAVELA